MGRGRLTELERKQQESNPNVVKVTETGFVYTEKFRVKWAWQMAGMSFRIVSQGDIQRSGV